MPRAYQCRGCKFETDYYWFGVCPSCQRPYNCNAPKPEKPQRTAASAQDVKPPEIISTGVPELDRVLGGGVALGAVILVGAPRGVGKTTLLLQAAENIAKTGRKVILASGEMNDRDIAGYVQRLGLKSENLIIMGFSGDVEEMMDQVEEIDASVLIVDSVNTTFKSDCKGEIGGDAQVNAVADFLTAQAKKKEIAVFLISHLNKQGDYKGTEDLQHLVDVLLQLHPVMPEIDKHGEEDPETKGIVSLSIDGKNRYGSVDVVEEMQMTGQGLQSIQRKKKSKLELVRDRFGDDNE